MKYKMGQVDLTDMGSGTAEFLRQLAPKDQYRLNAKKLLLNDDDYSTPQDHYFGYINKIQGENPDFRDQLDK